VDRGEVKSERRAYQLTAKKEEHRAGPNGCWFNGVSLKTDPCKKERKVVNGGREKGVKKDPIRAKWGEGQGGKDYNLWGRR